MAKVRESYFWHHFYNGRSDVAGPLTFPGWSAVCFHKPEAGCECRKPKLGLWYKEIQPVYNVQMKDSWHVDTVDNLEFGRSLGMQLAAISPEDTGLESDTQLYGSLHHFAETLLEKKISWTPVTLQEPAATS